MLVAMALGGFEGECPFARGGSEEWVAEVDAEDGISSFSFSFSFQMGAISHHQWF